jgi:hypothetical protein
MLLVDVVISSLLLFIRISYSYPNKESGVIILLLTSLQKFSIMLSLNQVSNIDTQYTNHSSLASISLTIYSRDDRSK